MEAASAIVPVKEQGAPAVAVDFGGRRTVHAVTMRTYMEKFLARRGLARDDVRRRPYEKGPLLHLPEGLYMAVPMGEKGFGYLRLADVKALVITPKAIGFLMAGGRLYRARGKAEALIGRYERALAAQRALIRSGKAQHQGAKNAP